MTSDETIKNCSSKMKKAFEVFSHELSSLRTGRANASMLDIIKVDVYGQKMSINQLATITTPEARTLNVQVWDQNNVSLIDTAIRKSNIGVNPQIDGQLMRIPIPSLNEERRNELKKIMGGLAEKAKVSIRNIRREANDKLKKDLKDKKIGEDESKKSEKKIQNITDNQITELVNDFFVRFNISFTITNIINTIILIFFIKMIVLIIQESFKANISAKLQFQLRTKVVTLYSKLNYQFYTDSNIGYLNNL